MLQFGIDNFLRTNSISKQKRIALVTNHAATTHDFIPSRKALLDKGFNMIKLFSPEHGLDVQGVDGASMKDGYDALTNLPIISLYNEKLAPAKNDLDDIDLVLFDIPDIGVRYYTYLWTMTHVLEACAAFDKKLILLDRPNPISGNMELSEGPLLDEKNCASFIGRWNIPLKHSCTIGELAFYFNRTRNLQADMEVIQCSDWNRNDFQPGWDMPFIPTSPAIRTFQSALLYPGLGLLEATNISEGRGTDKAFQIIGAPWLETNLLIPQLDARFGHNIHSSFIQFTPKESKYTKELCHGISFEVKDMRNFKAVEFGYLLIKIIKDIHPENFSWNVYPTHVNPTGKHHLDKLTGLADSEALFDLSMNDFTIKLRQLLDTHVWQKTIQPFLLY